MRTEMKRLGVITQDQDENLQVIDRTFGSASSEESLLTILVHGVYAQLSNICHNFDPGRKDATWPNRVAYTKSLRKSDTKQLRRVTKDRIVDFVESMDDVFMAYESLQDSDEDVSKVVAIGIYYFEENDENAEYEW